MCNLLFRVLIFSVPLPLFGIYLGQVWFSLIFGVSFISFDNPERGSSRFTSLLGKFGLADRMRATDSEPLYAKIGMARWAAVKSAMEIERQRGLHFLIENLA